MWRGLAFDRIPLSEEEAGSATLGVAVRGWGGGVARFETSALAFQSWRLLVPRVSGTPDDPGAGEGTRMGSCLIQSNCTQAGHHFSDTQSALKALS